MRVQETKVYTFEELSDRAKERARQWFREGQDQDNFWSESVIEDVANMANIIGIDLRTRAAILMGGGTRMEPCVYWSGFSSQGDGACFEGSYAYKKGAAKAIRKEAPEDTTLHGIADALQAVQRAHFYRLSARVKHQGHYSHEMCTVIEVFDDATGNETDDAATEAVKDALRNFMRWIYRQLETEYDWQNADAQVDENIIANEYEFTEDGRRA